MMLRALPLKKKKVLLSVALVWWLVWPIAENAKATTLRSENTNASIQMENDGGTVLPFTSLDTSNSAALPTRTNVIRGKNFEGIFRSDLARRQVLASSRPVSAPTLPLNQFVGEGVALNLGVKDLFILFLKAIDGNGADVMTSFIRKNAFIRDALLGDTSNLINFDTISNLNANRAEFGLLDQDWANFRLIAMSNMTASASVWLEGRQWASFHGTVFPLDGIGSLQTEYWGSGSLSKSTHSATQQSGLISPTTNNQYSSSQNRARGPSADKTHKPIRTTTLKEFVLNMLTRVLRSPMFYIVLAGIALLFASRQLMRARGS